MMRFSGFSKYGTFNLRVRIVWNTKTGADLRITYHNIIYLNFTKDVLRRAENTFSTNAGVHPACN